MLDDVAADIPALTSQERRRSHKLGVILFHSGLHAVLLYRLSRWLDRHHLGPLAVLLGYAGSIVTGAQISPKARIGKGFVIFHPYGIVVGSTTVIGSHCTLVHGNVIGQLYGGGDRPVIGDHFYAATGAKVLGRITIGDRVRVGPNTVVVRSLPEGVTVGTRPARILSIPRAGSADLSSTDAPRHRAADHDVTISRLVQAIRVTLPGGRTEQNIDEETGLLGQGIGVDSIEMLSLISAVEEEFGITIDEAELEPSHFKTVGTFASLLSGHLRR
jgi:serine O-acetyltransferase